MSSQQQMVDWRVYYVRLATDECPDLQGLDQNSYWTNEVPRVHHWISCQFSEKKFEIKVWFLHEERGLARELRIKWAVKIS